MTRPADYQKYRGKRQRERILAVAKIPVTARTLAAALNLTTSSINIYTKLMMAEPRTLRIGDYDRSLIGKPAPMYVAGAGPDAVFNPKRKDKLADRRQTQLARVLKALEIPCTALEVAVIISRAPSRAHAYIRDLRDDKKVYIADYQKPDGRGARAPIYAVGDKRDKKLKRQTRAQRHKRDMADDDRRERIQTKRKTHDNLARLAKKPHGIFSALGVHP